MLTRLEFITPTLMTVFELFLADPMRDFHEREVVRRTGVSLGSANKILRRLAGLGFLMRDRRGRMVFYKLNARDPEVRQFKVLVNLHILRELVDELKRFSRRIVLFGSCAEGTDVKESDIDLFVLASEKGTVRSKISEFNRESERKVAPIVVGASEFAKLKRKDLSLIHISEPTRPY